MHSQAMARNGIATALVATACADRAPTIDVSAYAASALMFGDVRMDAEAFGVTVTRRVDASLDNLSPYERARLLDVLWHAQRKQLACLEGEQAFPVWTISSDARDAQPRNIWLIISRTPQGSYLIGLSDV